MGAEEDEEVSRHSLSPPCCCQAEGGGGPPGRGQRLGALAYIRLCACHFIQTPRAGSAVHFQFLHAQSCLRRTFGLQKSDRGI